MLVCHKCDNRKCVNPEHLFIGTAMDNNKDMIEKGREVYAHGSTHYRSDLTDDDVINIRALHKSGMIQRRIAEMYSIGYKAINKIVKRQRWKHI